MLRLLRISRPRFWIYTFGPYIVGALAGATRLGQFAHALVIAFALFFLIPANLLIYGVNDIFDYETDRLNRKKVEYETLVAPSEHKLLWPAIAVSCTPFAMALFWCPPRAWVAMAAFLFFSLFYSAPPIRAKARPVMDSAFNVLYACPGVFAYFLVSEKPVSIPLLIAAWAWTAAMHAYSAVPDIAADSASGLNTIATRFGFRGTLWICLGLYLTSALISLPVLSWLSMVLGLIYSGMMLLSLRAGSEEKVLAIYRWFPWLNTLAGAGIFFTVLRGKGWI